MERLEKNIDRLVCYGLKTGLIDKNETIFSRNLLLDILGEESYHALDDSEAIIQSSIKENNESAVMTDDELADELSDILEGLLDVAVQRGIIKDSVTFRDLFDTKIMNAITPRPSTVIAEFRKRYEDSPKKATDYFYRFCKDIDYIRRYRARKDIRWKVDSDYGQIDITINLAKPEKDPAAIAAAGKAKSDKYPKCQLCMDNIGYAGRADHPARQTLRVIPIRINNSDWGFQYSPYGYYNEHCIVFNGEHIPMKVERDTFVKLFDFVEQFPHYFLGSNADLPIVGGSILSHDHYQGGCYEFAMERADVEYEFTVPGFEDINAGIVKWPMSVIRLSDDSREKIIDLATNILDKWRSYSDGSLHIFAETDGEPHNAITPIARMRDGKYELDLVLRNNITTDERPLGLFHPRPEYHHIKKENIGLIEVMGLAVLPSRLKHELELLKEAMLEGRDISNDPALAAHSDWADEIRSKYKDINPDNVSEIIDNEVGKVFVGVLEDAGVFKCDGEGREGFKRFIGTL